MRKVTLLILVVLLGFVATQSDFTGFVIAQDCGHPPCEEPWPQYCYDFYGGWWDPTICACHESPIIIDLSNDGYNLTDVANGVRFDLGGKGKKHQWSWTARGSNVAFLALDRDGDRKVTSGKELFGSATDQPVFEEPNGFNALAVFDDNHDHWIDANDAIYSNLLLWVDSTHDGVSQRRELFSLRDKGVEAISCDYRLSKRSDRYGNKFRYKSMARINGVERRIWDVFFMGGK